MDLSGTQLDQYISGFSFVNLPEIWGSESILVPLPREVQLVQTRERAFPVVAPKLWDSFQRGICLVLSSVSSFKTGS